eukprot:TRINITY_DN11579_c0_g1_i8.p1 TRINITY_DN11579_c0_g1~~TRINITY_DN11579_c0_g1_i8.p1  ORF type:complete len:221 (+),score=33.42 TRINITY_DN11579_c0_g1_i8:1053-1715(+)
MYSNFLVWSGLEQDDMHTIYRYAVNPKNKILLPTDGFLFVGESKRPEPPTIFIGNKANRESIQLSLVVFRFMECTCFFLVNPSSTRNDNFYANLSRSVIPQLTFLGPVISEHAKKITQNTEDFRYLYFNHMNLALKTTLVRDKLSVDLVGVLNQMHNEFERSDMISEMLIETQSDGWVVGRKSDHREFYIVFEQKNAYLLQINEEMKKLSTSYFKDIFID